MTYLAGLKCRVCGIVTKRIIPDVRIVCEPCSLTPIIRCSSCGHDKHQGEMVQGKRPVLCLGCHYAIFEMGGQNEARLEGRMGRQYTRGRQ